MHGAEPLPREPAILRLRNQLPRIRNEASEARNVYAGLEKSIIIEV